MNLRRYFKLIALLVCITSNVWAQGYIINYYDNVGNPKTHAIINGNPVDTAWNQYNDTYNFAWTDLIVGTQSTNKWSNPAILPANFSFKLYDVRVDTFWVSANGLLTFSGNHGAVPPAGDNTTLPASGLPDSTICAFWDSFTSNPPTSSSSKVSYTILGTVGYRQLWIKWATFALGNPAVTAATFSIVLEENTNRIFIVDHNLVSGGNLTATIGIQANNIKSTMYSDPSNPSPNMISHVGLSSAADNDLYELILVPGNEAGITSIDGPGSPVTPGNQPVTVSLKNFGGDPLTSVNIQWSVNGVLQPPFAWTGLILPGGGVVPNVQIGTYPFALSSIYKICAWTSLPNGFMDTNTSNDTSCKYVYSPMSGVYTIGGPTANFPNFTEAVTALNLAGVAGNVTFNVIPGTGPFNEQVQIGTIVGASATNTISFNGTNKDTIMFQPTSQKAIFKLTGSKHITFNNLTVWNKGNAFGYGFHFTSMADSNTIKNCNIILNNVSTNPEFIGIAVAGASISDFGPYGTDLTIDSCQIRGGYYSVLWNGTNMRLAKRMKLSHSQLFESYMGGLVSANGGQLEVMDNTIKLRNGAPNSSFGINFQNSDLFKIHRNYILQAGQYGIYLKNMNPSASNVNRSDIYNNMIGAGFKNTAPVGIMFDTNCAGIDVYHNSVSIVNQSGTAMKVSPNGLSRHNIMNNSFAVYNSPLGLALDVSSATDVDSLNYNNYYTQNSSKFIFIGNSFSRLNYRGGASKNQESRDGEPGYRNNNSDLHCRRSQLSNWAKPGLTLVDIDGQTRPMLGGIPDVGADEFNPAPIDVGVYEVVPPITYDCGASTDSITLKIRNYGVLNVQNVPVSARMFGPANQIVTGTYMGTILVGDSAEIRLGAFNTTVGGTFYFWGRTILATDTIPEDDSAFVAFSPLRQPTITPTNAVICGDSGVATVSVAPQADVRYSWFANATGTQFLANGTSFTTPMLHSGTTYYVQGVNLVQGHVGPSDSTLGKGEFVTNSGQADLGILFDVSRNCKLDSITIYTNADGPVTIRIRNVANTVIYTQTFNTVAGKNQLYLGFAILPGTGYKIDATGTPTSVRLYRSTLGSVFPYTINGIIQLKQNINLNPQSYYTFFYDWIVTIGECSSAIYPVSVSLSPKPIVNLGPDASACDTAFVVAGDGSEFYVWSNGTIGPVLEATQSGEYYVEVTNAAGCKARDTIQISILAGSKPDLGPDITTCNDSIVLHPHLIGQHYIWSNGDTTQTSTIKTSGTYSVRLLADGCEVRDTIQVTFINRSVLQTSIPDSAMLSSDTTLFISNVSGLTYEWNFGNGASPATASGAGPHVVRFDSLGPAIVTIQVTESCGTYTITDTVHVAQTINREDFIVKQAKIYPNPTQGTLQLDLPEALSLHISVTDVVGKKWVQTYMDSQHFTLDLSTLPQGMYFLILETNQGKWTQKIQKQ